MTDMITYDGMDAALLGYTSTEDEPQIAVYDYDLMVNAFMELNDWSQEEALEWIEFNVVGAYIGPTTPLIVHKFEELQH